MTQDNLSSNLLCVYNLILLFLQLIYNDLIQRNRRQTWCPGKATNQVLLSDCSSGVRSLFSPSLSLSSPPEPCKLTTVYVSISVWCVSMCVCIDS